MILIYCLHPDSAYSDSAYSDSAYSDSADSANSADLHHNDVVPRNPVV